MSILFALSGLGFPFAGKKTRTLFVEPLKERGERVSVSAGAMTMFGELTTVTGKKSGIVFSDWDGTVDATLPTGELYELDEQPTGHWAREDYAVHAEKVRGFLSWAEDPSDEPPQGWIRRMKPGS